MKNNTITNEKKEYERPRLRIIELKAEEVLAIGCKHLTTTAPGSNKPPCMIRHCSGKGS